MQLTTRTSHSRQLWLVQLCGLVLALAWTRAGWAGGESPSALTRESFESTGEVLVDLDDDVDEVTYKDIFSRLAVEVRPTALFETTRSFVLRAAPSRMDELRRTLERDDRVEIVEPNHRVRVLFEPNDPMLGEQWHLKRVNTGRAWDFATGRGVTVAVVDTGIACESFGPFTKASDLAETKCVSGYDFISRTKEVADDHGHGTHVAGTIAQSTDNGVGTAGVAFGARLMPVKVLDAMGWGSFATVADGIRFAADNGANVINLSLGGPFQSRAVEKAVRYARQRAVVVIAAAGNSGGSVDYPGASPHVLGVSATDPENKLARFSSRGAGVDIAAPGVGVVQQSICEGGKNHCELFPSWSGTSMASPHVAGTAALLASMGVTRPDKVEKLLLATAMKVDDSKEGRAQFGHGIVDAGAAVTRAALRKVVARTLSLSLMIFLVFRWARRRGRESLSPWRPGFLISALLTGPGLLFFAPLLLPRTIWFVDLLARPFADWDLLWSVQLHSALPLANVLIPLGVSLLLLNVRGMRGALAGLCVGTASYLCAEVLLQDLAFPLGAFALTVWCVINALLCATLARVILQKSAAGAA